MTFSSSARRAILSIATCGLVFAPIAARAGFLDQLFGGGMAVQAPIQQAPGGYDPSQGNLDFSPIAPTHRAKKRVAVVDKAPKLQKTTDLMSDKTLRPGDAIMMKTGVHVFNGMESSHHDADEFVSLREARHVSKQTRGELDALDVARHAPLKYIASNATQEGRSASNAQPISEGYRITDARGRSIRYVGP